MPYDRYIRNIDTNYYKLWLEEQTGLKLTFNLISEAYSAEYLEKQIASDNIKTDVFLSFNRNADFPTSQSRIQSYGEKGYIIPLNRFITDASNLGRILTSFSHYDMRTVMTAEDGNIYYVPALDVSDMSETAQVFWININWLKRLKMTIPQTTDELYAVLSAFRNNDPNGNGVADEIPLAGATDDASLHSYNFLINAFIYNDPENSRMYLKNGSVRFAPITSEWRLAMQYLNRMYKDGLLHPFQFSLDNAQLSELANNPADILGGFTSVSITDVLFQSSPEVINNFMHLPPLAGPGELRLATVKTPLPHIGGFITSMCKNPAAAFRLLDLMLSEEAFLISWYGERGVDWDYAAPTDIDSYGFRAKIKVGNSLSGRPQNKHIGKAGPFYTYPQYVNGITWSGYEADQAYVNARAYRTYDMYHPDEHIGMICSKQAQRDKTDAYTNERIVSFITGEADPYDDAVWREYLAGYEALGIDELIAEAQASYDLLKK